MVTHEGCGTQRQVCGDDGSEARICTLDRRGQKIGRIGRPRRRDRGVPLTSMTPQNQLFPDSLDIGRPPHGARSARQTTRCRWSPTEEIGWSRTQEIRWSPSQEIGWVRSEEILQGRLRLARDPAMTYSGVGPRAAAFAGLSWATRTKYIEVNFDSSVATLASYARVMCCPTDAWRAAA